MGSSTLRTARLPPDARYRRLFEDGRDGILLLEGDTGEVVDVNPFAATLTGYFATELVGRRLWDAGFSARRICRTWPPVGRPGHLAAQSPGQGPRP